MNQAPTRKIITRKALQKKQIPYIIRIIRKWGLAPFFPIFYNKNKAPYYKDISSWPPLNVFDGCRRLGRNFIGNTHHFRNLPGHSLRYLHENIPGDLSRFGCHGVFALH